MDTDQIFDEINKRLEKTGTLERVPDDLDPDLPGQGIYHCYEVGFRWKEKIITCEI